MVRCEAEGCRTRLPAIDHDGAMLCKKCVRTRIESIPDSPADCIDTEDAQPHVVVNELLAYCSYYIDRSTTDAIKDVIIRFYTADEINVAKCMLYNSCPTVLGVAPVHRDTAARGAHVIAAREIVDGIHKVDEDPKVRHQFAAVQLDRLPQYGPEELDLTSVVMRLRQLERQYDRLDGEMAQCKDSVATIQAQPSRVDSYAAATKRRVLPTTKESSTIDLTELSVKLPMSTTPSVDVATTNDAAPQKVLEDDIFVVPREQKRREARRRRNNEATVKGNKQTGKLRAGTRYKDVFVFNLDGDTTGDDLKTFFKEELNMDVVETECRSHEDAPNKSYRVVILEKDFAKATDPNNIPEGISIRPYYRGNRVTTRNTNYDSNGRI